MPNSSKYRTPLIIAITAFLMLILVDSVSSAFPLLAGYVLVIAYASARLPLVVPIILCVLATAIAGQDPLFSGEQGDWTAAIRVVANRGLVLGIVIWLVRRLADGKSVALIQSLHDELTGLPNRRLLLERLEAERNRSSRSGKPLTIAFLDCNDFKRVNDANGHAAGDRVLQEIARTLSSAIRDYDLVARWGGDEFIVLFPETDAERAQTAVSRLLPHLEDELKAAGSPVKFSAGVVTILDSQLPAEALIRRADEAMYAAKRSPEDQAIFVVLDADAVAASRD